MPKRLMLTCCAGLLVTCRLNYELLPGSEAGGSGHAGQSGMGSTGGQSGGGAGSGGSSGAPGIGGSSGSTTGGAPGTGASGGTLGGSAGASGAGASTGSGGTGGDAGQPGGGSGGTGGSPNLGNCSSASFMGHDYAVCAFAQTFSEAGASCETLRMRLIRIDSSEENTWFCGAVTNGWIGASDALVEGEWRWSDGELFWLGEDTGTAVNGRYEAWSGADPSGRPSDADCARVDSSGRVWVDVRCSDLNPFVCEAY